ncbi:3-oxoacyl-[acyl-carrier protein] reductase [Alkalispirochaeta americana]|uniref:3-oxoacyl-[acyl-carrier protein] reductase n=1 Tax=Alkalispirochaeta americana TaxID=159291 RepID=A0A1N6Y7Q2_9SPIO|nr:SDR family NAD(P)-dependent oxidoreductase [Alkalispirochaeta americana]SIR10652.1 3-oxoacyl-[acyl-carrier protein] reductase [Alkalispirochaeta americana]
MYFFTYWRPYDKTMLWGLKDDEPEKIQKEILGLGVRCEKLEIDLMDEESIKRIFETVGNKLGSASILINNATYSTTTDIGNVPSQELDKHYFVNLRAPILLTSFFVKQFEEKQQGRVINITSGQSLSAMSGEIAYAVTKGAIETFTRTMQHELAYKNITINAVNPGLTDSGWLNSGCLDEKQINIFRNRFPKGRLGLPSDAAKLVGFLVQENAD